MYRCFILLKFGGTPSGAVSGNLPKHDTLFLKNNCDDFRDNNNDGQIMGLTDSNPRILLRDLVFEFSVRQELALLPELA